MATVATLGAAAPEAKLREELRKRAQKVNEFWRSVSGFIESLDLVNEACGKAENLVLDNIVHYADPAMRVSMLSRLNLARTDYLRQAEELAHFAQSTEI
ncbi:hypothetical protein PC112_g237 [Phytophthora cactorum]|nr:hypothetical protein PC112_g237 [Phytophthora cactorum]